MMAAIGFGAWPLIARYASLGGSATALLISLGTLFPVVIGLKFLPFAHAQMPIRAILIGLLAGAVNGAGFLAYSRIISNRDLDFSVYVPIMVLLSMFVTTAGSVILFGEKISLDKVIGLILMLLSIYFLSR